MICPLPALLPSASVNPIASRVRSVSSRTLCCSDPAGRLPLSLSPLRAYIEFFISLGLSPLTRKQMLLNLLSLIFKYHHRWVRIESSGMANVRQQIGIRVGGEIYTRTMYVLPVCLVPLTYILRTCSLDLYLIMASQLLQYM